MDAIAEALLGLLGLALFLWLVGMIYFLIRGDFDAGIAAGFRRAARRTAALVRKHPGPVIGIPTGLAIAWAMGWLA